MDLKSLAIWASKPAPLLRSRQSLPAIPTCTIKHMSLSSLRVPLLCSLEPFSRTHYNRGFNRAPTKGNQLHTSNPHTLSEDTYRSPLPNISTPSSPENAIWGPQNPLRGNAGKFWEIQGFLLNHIEMPRKRPIQGNPGNSFWGSRTGILGRFSWADENGQS